MFQHASDDATTTGQITNFNPSQKRDQQWQTPAMMHVSQLHGYSVYEPANNRELLQWRPSTEVWLQFVKIARGHLWIFHAGHFLGCAQQLVGLEAWQASSDERGCCIAPLDSPLACAWSLLEYNTGV